jgi:O-acetyl-ADP-ribose deacetylase (regulator of RNase III)
VSEFAVRLLFERDKVFELHGPGDITKAATDAIVNAANSSLLGGGGVDGAIHNAGGPAILAECRAIVDKIGHLPAGHAVMTTGGCLPAKYVIHTVGPIFRGGGQGEAVTLASCYRESIRIADNHALRSLAFPSISTGAFGYPITEAAVVAVRAVIEALSFTTRLQHVRFVLFDRTTLHEYVRAVDNLHESGTISPKSIKKATQ